MQSRELVFSFFSASEEIYIFSKIGVFLQLFLVLLANYFKYKKAFKKLIQGVDYADIKGAPLF